MSINKETVEYVAHLARIELRQDELDTFCAQLKDILGFIGTLSALDIQDVAPTSHILPVSNVLRVDQPQMSLPVDAVLINAPRRDGNFFGVPKIIE